MSDRIVSVTAGVLESALALFAHPSAWPDLASGFASRLLASAQLDAPVSFGSALRSTTSQRLRRAPELAAFGYVIGHASSETHVAWTQAFERLMGRDPFPSDRNSFIYNPLELLGIALGVVGCPGCSDAHREWLAGTIQRGFANQQFGEPVIKAVAICAEMSVAAKVRPDFPTMLLKVPDLPPGDLAFLVALTIMFPGSIPLDASSAQTQILRRVLSATVPLNDGAEAAALYVVLKLTIEQLHVTGGATSDPAETVVVLCRRFQLFVDRLRSRQRGRPSFAVADEYDVQDLLHGILKLHFDDVRPEEWCPSYAASSSRTDFLLPRERVIVEAKMTRAGLGQKEVANELIIDAARYSKMESAEHLVCLIYDPARRCQNPTALERDLAQTAGRLKMHAVVCPHGT